MEVGKGGDYIPVTHCYHQNVSCIKISSDENHYCVLLIVRDNPGMATSTLTQLLNYDQKGCPLVAHISSVSGTPGSTGV